MAYKITYKKSVFRDVNRIDKSRIKKIIDKLEKKLKNDPLSGKALEGEFKGLFRLRVGDYRIIYAVLPEEVLVLRIAHRKESYR